MEWSNESNIFRVVIIYSVAKWFMPTVVFTYYPLGPHCILQVAYQWNEFSYHTLISNDTLCTLYEKHASTFGWQTEYYPESMPSGSTDMGNVSHVVPSIHPVFRIGTEAANHTKGFTEASGGYS